MTTKTQTTTTTDTQIPTDSPAVLAYRVGQLEITTKEGLYKVTRKLDDMAESFATKDDVKVLQEQIDGIKRFAKWLVSTCVTIIGVVAVFITGHVK